MSNSNRSSTSGHFPNPSRCDCEFHSGFKFNLIGFSSFCAENDTLPVGAIQFRRHAAPSICLRYSRLLAGPRIHQLAGNGAYRLNGYGTFHTVGVPGSAYAESAASKEITESTWMIFCKCIGGCVSMCLHTTGMITPRISAGFMMRKMIAGILHLLMI